MRNSKKQRLHFRLRRSRRRSFHPSFHSLQSHANNTVPRVQQTSRDPNEDMLTRIMIGQSLNFGGAEHDKFPETQDVRREKLASPTQGSVPR